VDLVLCIIRSFREQIRGFYNLLRQKSSSLFMLKGWSTTSTASLTMCSMYLAFVVRMEASWNKCSVLDWCRVQLQLACLGIPVRCDFDAPLIWCPWNSPSDQCGPCCTHRGSCKHLVSLVLGCLWQDEGDWIISCGASPQIWCCVGPALCWFSWI
jgi:hypothetical protein